jgi:hypothetical protein
MGRFDRLPGIDSENTRRRNVLVGAGYALAGCLALGAAAPSDDESEDETKESTDGGAGGDGGGGGGGGSDDGGGGGDGDGGGGDDKTKESNGDGGGGDDESQSATETPDPDPSTPTDEPTATPTEAPPTAGELGAVSDNLEWLDPATSRSGSGQVVTDSFGAARFTAFVYEHDGESNFIVELIDDASGETVDILVNEIGSVAGAVGVGLSESQYILDVDADGDWAIDIGEPDAPDGEWGMPPATITDERPDVYGEVEIDGRVTVTGEHTGESNFIVSAWDEMNTRPFPDEVIFNEIGDFEGETSERLSGVFYLTVDADGPYQISIE